MVWIRTRTENKPSGQQCLVPAAFIVLSVQKGECFTKVDIKKEQRAAIDELVLMLGCSSRPGVLKVFPHYDLDKTGANMVSGVDVDTKATATKKLHNCKMT